MGNLPSESDRKKSPLALRDRTLVTVTSLLGNVSLLLMAVFVFKGSLDLVDLGLGEVGALVLNTCLSIAFFIQHSGMIRASFRRCSAQFMAEKYHGALFTVASAVLLILLVVLWQKSNYTLFSAEGALRWVLRAVFFLCIIGFYWGIRSLGKFDAYGLRPILRNIQSATATAGDLKVRGPYRWVRHPLYLFCILMIWSCPDLTADRLLFNLLWTAWIVVGTILEERDLVAQFGEGYRTYQTQVPMLIPSTFRHLGITR
ncbi:MAG: isoprenylcysteine carboxylmethyltransferase family protein [Desulfomonile tiedjei]|nr:isoprenylcysteine carboxylmethyltransferase family protein [Desulfomonile tiedjei]